MQVQYSDDHEQVVMTMTNAEMHDIVIALVDKVHLDKRLTEQAKREYRAIIEDITRDWRR